MTVMHKPWIVDIVSRALATKEYASGDSLMECKNVQCVGANSNLSMITVTDAKHSISAFLTPEAREQLEQNSHRTLQSLRNSFIHLTDWVVSNVGTSKPELGQRKPHLICLQLRELRPLGGDGASAAEDNGDVNENRDVLQLAQGMTFRQQTEALCMAQGLPGLPDMTGALSRAPPFSQEEPLEWHHVPREYWGGGAGGCAHPSSPGEVDGTLGLQDPPDLSDEEDDYETQAPSARPMFFFQEELELRPLGTQDMDDGEHASPLRARSPAPGTPAPQTSPATANKGSLGKGKAPARGPATFVSPPRGSPVPPGLPLFQLPDSPADEEMDWFSQPTPEDFGPLSQPFTQAPWGSPCSSTQASPARGAAPSPTLATSGRPPLPAVSSRGMIVTSFLPPAADLGPETVGGARERGLGDTTSPPPSPPLTPMGAASTPPRAPLSQSQPAASAAPRSAGSATAWQSAQMASAQQNGRRAPPSPSPPPRPPGSAKQGPRADPRPDKAAPLSRMLVRKDERGRVIAQGYKVDSWLAAFLDRPARPVHPSRGSVGVGVNDAAGGGSTKRRRTG